MCQGPTFSDETQGKSGSRKTPTEEKRAGQAGKVLAVGMCLKQGRTETVGSRSCRVGKKGQKPFLRRLTTKDLPGFMSAGRSLHRDMKTEIMVLPGPSLLLLCPLLPSQSPWPLFLLQFLLPLVSSNRSSQIFWREEVCQGQSCRITQGFLH